MRTVLVFTVLVLAGCQSGQPYPPGQGPGDGLIRAAELMKPAPQPARQKTQCKVVFDRLVCEPY